MTEVIDVKIQEQQLQQLQQEQQEQQSIDLLKYPESEFLFHISNVYANLNSEYFQDVTNVEITPQLEYIVTQPLNRHVIKIMPIATCINISDTEVLLKFNNIPFNEKNDGNTASATSDISNEPSAVKIITNLNTITCQKTLLDIILGAFILGYKYKGTISIPTSNNTNELYGIESIVTHPVDIWANISDL